MRRHIACLVLVTLAATGCNKQLGDSPSPDLIERTELGPIVDVDLRSVKFDPDRLTVEQGTLIEFTNADPTYHAIATTDGRYDGGYLQAGERFVLNATDPGTFSMRCTIHPEMRMRLRITEVDDTPG